MTIYTCKIFTLEELDAIVCTKAVSGEADQSLSLQHRHQPKQLNVSIEDQKRSQNGIIFSSQFLQHERVEIEGEGLPLHSMGMNHNPL